MHLPQVVIAENFTINGNGKITKSSFSKDEKNYCNFKKLTVNEVKSRIIRIASKENFDISFTLTIARFESNWGQNLYSKDKNGNVIAVGIMQLIPATAKRFKVNECDHSENILGGIRYLKWLFKEFNDPMLVAAAYNAGEGRIYEYGGIPPFKETVKYTANVMNAYKGQEQVKCFGCNSINENKLTKVNNDENIFKAIEEIGVQLIGIRAAQSSVIHVN